MSRVGFLADVHAWNHRVLGGPVSAGLNARGRMVVDALALACRRADQLGCEALFVLGDLFDGARPEPQLITLVAEALAQFGSRVFLLVGNHDQVSMADGDHALGPLRRDGSVFVVERPSWVKVSSDLGVFLVPFAPGDAAALIRTAARSSAAAGVPGIGKAVVGVHAGVRTAATPPWLRDAPDSLPFEVLRDLGFRAAFAGNWHSRELSDEPPGKCPVLQVGALCPTGFDNPGLGGYGTLAVFDTADRPSIRYEVIPGPRFLTQQPGDEELARLQAEGMRVFCRLTVPSAQAPFALAWVEQAKAAGLLAGGEVVPVDERDEQAPAWKPPGQASLLQQLEEYVGREERALPTADIVAKTKGYLGI